jgi:hypothetical protein
MKIAFKILIGVIILTIGQLSSDTYFCGNLTAFIVLGTYLIIDRYYKDEK